MEPQGTLSLMHARKSYLRLGWSLVVMEVGAQIGAVLIALLGAVLASAGHDVSGTWWYFLLSNFLPIYLFGMPFALLILRRAPAERPEPLLLSAKTFFQLLLICFPLLYIGSLIGNMVSNGLSGGLAENTLELLAEENAPLMTLSALLIAPLGEEFFFRRQIIDRCSQYGEKTAILYSGLAFGLFHMNFYQFFYAFALGVLLAYVYTRTRRLRYTILLHMSINFIGSLPNFLPGFSEAESAAENADSLVEGVESAAEALSGSELVVTVYGLCILALTIWGFIYLLRRARHFVLFPAPEELPRRQCRRAAYLNAGMIVFLLLSLVMFVLALGVLTLTG